MEGDDESWTRSLESGEEAPRKVSLIREAEHLLAADEIKFTIPKDRYEEVKTVAIAAILSLIEIPDCCYGLNQENKINYSNPPEPASYGSGCSFKCRSSQIRLPFQYQ